MVNVTDRVAAPYPGDKFVWEQIWREQEELHHKYRQIEWEKHIGYGILRSDGRSIDAPRLLDEPRVQAYIKDLMWRFVEELQEAQEALYEKEWGHFKEELIDALHFMVELNVFLDIGPEPNKLFLSSSVTVVDPVYWYGLAANCLKNKPWKQTEQMTDRVKFERYIRLGNEDFRGRLLTVMNYEEVWDLYSKKHQVNQFRQESNY